MPTRSSLFADLVYRGNCVRRLLEPAHAAPNRLVSPPGAEGQRRIDSFAPWSQ